MSSGILLKQIREQRHLKIEDVAKYTQISQARLSDFERGDAEPSYIQIEKLSEVYGVPSYLVAGRMIPNLREVLPDFRRPDPSPAKLSAAGLKKVWTAYNTAEFTKKLARAVDFPKAKWGGIGDSEKIGLTSARRARHFFDEWYARRKSKLGLSGPEEGKFFMALRLFLETRRVVVTVNDAPADDYQGFFVNHDEGEPLIFINRSIASKKAQLFTLVHELGHRLIGEDGVSDPFKTRNRVERLCNKFAAEFIAPLDTFSACAEKMPRQIRSDHFALITRMSQNSLLSRHATAIRLREAGLVSQDQLRDWERIARRTPQAEKNEEKEAAANVIAPPHARRVGEVGYLPTYLSKIAVEKKLIDDLDVQAGISLSRELQPKAFDLAARRVEAALEE